MTRRLQIVTYRVPGVPLKGVYKGYSKGSRSVLEYRGLNNYQYYFAGCLFSIIVQGAPNPIVIIQAPILIKTQTRTLTSEATAEN